MLSGRSVIVNGQEAKRGYSSIDLETMKAGDRIGILKKSCGFLHFLINGTDLGEAVSKLPVVVYGAVDVYGAAVRVSIVSREEECKIVKSNSIYTRGTNVCIYGAAEQPEENSDNLAVDFFKSELNVDVASNDISRSYLVGKKSRAKPGPIIVRFTKPNTKDVVMSRRRVLKECKCPFNLQEDLTVNRCKSL